MRITRLLSFLLLFTISVVPAFSQGSYPVFNLNRATSGVHAFTNCTLVTEPGKTIENGVLVIRNGMIENAGRNLKVPADAAVHDLNGAWVYPGFIDPYSNYAVPKLPKRKGGNGRPQYNGSRLGPFAWNDAVRPEYLMASGLKPDPKKREKWRGMGFTTINATPNDGIFRGQSAILNLGNGHLSDEILLAKGIQCMSFSKGSSKQSYPSSLMGGIALIRQMFYDANWYSKVRDAKKNLPNTPKVETNLSLDALTGIKDKLPSFFECQDLNDIFRARKIGEEFGLSFVYKTSGNEYQRIDDIKKANVKLIVPLKFPEAFNITDPTDAREVSLRKMMHWEQAPLNPAILARSKVSFALTTAGLKSPEKEFWPALRKAIQHGLSEEDALRALTMEPARMLGLEKILGSLEPGKMANFIVADKNLFAEEKSQVFQTWVNGKEHPNKPFPEVDPLGKWDLSLGQRSYSLMISGSATAPSAKVAEAIDTLSAKINITGLSVLLLIPESKSPKAGKTRLVGLLDGKTMSGRGETSDGKEIRWSAVWKSELDKKDKKEPTGMDLSDIPRPNYPFGPYGFVEAPKEQPVLIKNATVWTNTDQGVLENADVLIERGKIVAVGKGLRPPGNAQVVDGTGKHLTSGIIDEHSHIGISRGVNEGSHNVTAEVRIGDVINPNDVNIYRQMAGGVTTSQLLHGSANPIGGQSAIIKLRWGALAEDMKFTEAPGFIKFALGENVKQSNWGENHTSRYPQTRMGVEQLISDAFSAALAYRLEAGGNGRPRSALPLRKDLQKETLLEIIDGKRFVTCHSYVQSEITMLMRVAESFGFRINTFTHILEGYKIADKMKAHGVNGSTFSDWWAYKYEVIDAIPYNAAMMHKQGINACINSDDAEMGRRLNQEAAKAILYGGISEEEALKLVTLNPAKALHIDEYVGSLEPGKHGDVVLWTDHPLSVYAKVQQTYIDGRCYYDADRNEQMQQVIEQERKRLQKKLMSEGKKGKGAPPTSKGKRLDHCDTIESDYNHE